VTWTHDELAELVQLLDEGRSLSELSEWFGPDRLEISMQLRLLGRGHRRPQKWTPRRLQKLVALFESGKSRVQLADHFGVSCKSIATRLAALGYRVAPRERATRAPCRPAFSAAEARRLAELRDAGLTYQQIADQTGVSLSRVVRSIRRLRYG
jgi:hypothetical protein